MDVAAWLRGLGLERYAPAFRDNDIDSALLRRLTAEDLRELGVASVGHRRRLLDAIAAFDASTPAADASGPAVQTVTILAPKGDAERRQLTVMFCDLVGSTPLSARLDPEDLREVIAAYHRAVADVVRSFDGFVAKYMGDGVLVYFGYPRAHEDDAERAVRAGLGVVESVGRLDVKSANLRARVGIGTGLVVVGDLIGEGSAQEQSVVGETPNLAARLQALAEPDTVVIAAATRRLVGDLFEVRDLGGVEVKGIAAPVPAWQVLRPSGVDSRFEALRGSALTPLVGRDEEIDLLLRRWARARGGDGQVVLVSGEPGIGKSRLTTALTERLHAEPHFRLRYFCSPHHQDSVLYPFIGQLERAAGFTRKAAAGARLDQLEGLLAQAGDTAAETTALFADLLGLPAEGRYPPLPRDPQRRRELTLSALVGQFEGLARQRPVLLLFEDAHWADSTSRELLDRAIEQLPRLPVLMVVTYRPEFVPPWVGQAQVTLLALNRLGDREAAAIAGNVAGRKRLPAEILDRIVQRTDGIPLFVEELTKSLLEGGLLREETDRYVLDSPLPPLAIPPTLHTSLMARLDRLAPVKEVAQIGAVIGREFSWELLAAVARRSESQLGDALDQLVAAGLVYRRGTPPRATFTFKHALVQDTAYTTLLRGQRQEFHARIGRVLEEQFAEIAEAHPEILAHHYTAAALDAQAVDWLRRAGAKASAKGANREAAAHYERALASLCQLPQDAPTIELGIDLRLELRNVLSPLREVASALNHVSEAEALARSLRDSGRLARALTHKMHTLWMGGRLADACVAGEEAVAIANTVSDSSLSVSAWLYLGQVHYSLADYPRAAGLFQNTIAALAGNRATDRLGLHSYPSVLARIFLADCSSITGEFDDAEKRAREAVELANVVDDGYSRAAAHCTLGSVHLQKGEIEAAIPALECAASLCRTHVINSWMKGTLSNLCLAYALVGRITDTQPVLEEATRWVQFPGRADHIANVCLVNLLTGCLHAAAKLAELGLDRARTHGERANLARCLNVFAEIELTRDSPDFNKAGDSYRQALAQATALGMRPLIAHCHAGLAKLYYRTAKRADSKEHLAAAATMYRDMGMTYWLQRAEMEIAGCC